MASKTKGGIHTWVLLGIRPSEAQIPKPTRQAPGKAGASAGSAALARLESSQDKKKSSLGTSKTGAAAPTTELQKQHSSSTSEPEAASEASGVVSKLESEVESRPEMTDVHVSH